MSVADTDCIVFSGTGAAATPFSAEPVIDPVADNLLECTATGMRAINPGSDMTMFGVSSAVVGGPPPSVGDGGWLWQTDSHVGLSDVLGHLYVPFPATFPSGVLAPVFCLGDRPLTMSILTIDFASITTAGFDVVCEAADGSGVLVGGSFRVNYVVAGW